MNSYNQLKALRNTSFLLIIALALSAFTHLWNPLGFPSIHYDEDTHYIPRALIFMNGGGPQQDPNLYDHPFFGQIFLATLFKLIGYPYTILHISNNNTETIRLLYMIPRVIMGLIAVLDTLLVYKISEVYYDKRVATIASVLFAVMPVTWIFRQVLLDNILLPFLLSSIYLAICSRSSAIHHGKEVLLALCSGFLLGLAIFTKIPSFTLIPLVCFFIYSKNSNAKTLAIWIIPVISIPLIWPAYAIYTGGFDLWVHGVIWQSTGRIYQPLPESIYRLLQIDPVLLVLSLAGFVYVAFKREIFLLLWIIPFFIFSFAIGFFSFFHLALVLPAFCIAGARLIRDLDKIITKKKNKQIITLCSFIGVAVFGIISTTALMSISASSSYFEATSFTNLNIPNITEQTSTNNKITIIGPPSYFWIPKYVFGKTENYYKSWWQPNIIQNNTTRILLIVPYGLMTERMSGTDQQAKGLQAIYHNTHIVATFDRAQNSTFDTSMYPFTSIKESPISGKIEIRSNY